MLLIAPEKLWVGCSQFRGLTRGSGASWETRRAERWTCVVCGCLFIVRGTETLISHRLTESASFRFKDRACLKAIRGMSIKEDTGPAALTSCSYTCSLTCMHHTHTLAHTHAQHTHIHIHNKYVFINVLKF